MALTEPMPAPPPQRGPPGAAWPIHLERKVTPGLTPGPKRHTVPPDARTSLDSAENEFMIFKGRHHAHWRQKFAGNYSYILLCAPARPPALTARLAGRVRTRPEEPPPPRPPCAQAALCASA